MMAHKRTIDDLIQERNDFRKILKITIKMLQRNIEEVRNISGRIKKLNKEIKELEKENKKK